MAIQGWYYLHENGSLIYKASPDAACDIRDSDFARAMWPMDVTDRAGAWNILVEASALSAKPERIKELAEKWNCDDADADNYANYLGISLQIDGNAWCATCSDFQNLQESPAGFGYTKLEAMAALCRDLGYTGGIMWNATFKDLCSGKLKQPTGRVSDDQFRRTTTEGNS